MPVRARVSPAKGTPAPRPACILRRPLPRTRWARPTTNASSTFTSLTPQASSPGAAATCRLGTFATAATLGTDPGNNLFAQDWNVLGGGGIIVLPIGGEWFVVFSATAGHQQVSCRNVAGIDANLSNYTVQWEE